jgi:hypothetical protein
MSTNATIRDGLLIFFYFGFKEVVSENPIVGPVSNNPSTELVHFAFERSFAIKCLRGVEAGL